MNKSEFDGRTEKIGIKRKSKVMEEYAIDHKKAVCPICSHELTSHWEPRYPDLRATCNECGTN